MNYKINTHIVKMEIVIQTSGGRIIKNAKVFT